MLTLASALLLGPVSASALEKAREREPAPPTPARGLLPRLTPKESARRRTEYPLPAAEAAPAEQEESEPSPAEGDDGGETQASREEDAPAREARSGEHSLRSAPRAEDERWEERSGSAEEPAAREEVVVRSGPEPTAAQAAILRALRRARSERALVSALRSIVHYRELDQEQDRQLFLGAVDRVGAPDARAHLLVAVLRRASITAETGRTLLDVARGISDDRALQRVLTQAHHIQEKDVMHGPLMPDLLRTVATLRTAAARGHALRMLLAEAPITVETGSEVLRMTAGLGDDGEAGEVLALMHRLRERDLVLDPLAADYLEVVRALSASAERCRALVALLERSPLPRSVVLAALELAQGLDSLGERRAVSQALSAEEARHPEVLRALATLTDPLAPSMRPPHVVAVGVPEQRASERTEADEDARKAREVSRRGGHAWVSIEPNDPAAHPHGARAQPAARDVDEAADDAADDTQVTQAAPRRPTFPDPDASPVARHARSLIQTEEEAFQNARRALRETAEQLRVRSEQVAVELREQIDQMREHVREELRRAGIEEVERSTRPRYSRDGE